MLLWQLLHEYEDNSQHWPSVLSIVDSLSVLNVVIYYVNYVY